MWNWILIILIGNSKFALTHIKSFIQTNSRQHAQSGFCWSNLSKALEDVLFRPPLSCLIRACWGLVSGFLFKRSSEHFCRDLCE